VSIDFTPIIDLSLTDIDADVLVAQAVLDGLTKWPEWVPHEADTEMVLLELLAAETSETVFAINRVPGTVLEAILGLYGVTQSVGTKATGTVRIVPYAPGPFVLPIGSRIRIGEIDFVTTAAAMIITPFTAVPVEAAQPGANANGISLTAAVDLVDTAQWFQSGSLVTTTGGGTEPETSTQYLVRASQRLSRVTDSLVTAQHFTAYCLEQSALGVGRANTVDLYDPAVGPVPGANLGHVTVAVSTANGSPLSPAAKATLLADMSSRCQAGLSIHLVDASIVTVPVTATIRRVATSTAAETLTNATAAVTALLSPASWPWGRSVQPNDVLAAIESAVGVDYVVGSLIAPAAAAFLLPWQLAALGAVSFTVVDPL
jgi:Baseplate J-like protein